MIGAILFEKTMNGEIDGKPVPEVLRGRGVVPFIKIDKGLEDEANGVQLMKPMPELNALLARARDLGVFGTKERSVINLANREGIAAIVKQQFEIGQQVLAAGLVPIIEPEVNIKSPERAAADAILLAELTKALDAMPGDDKVMLKLSLPVEQCGDAAEQHRIHHDRRPVPRHPQRHFLVDLQDRRIGMRRDEVVED